MTWSERFIYLLGILVILFGFIMVAGGLVNLFESSRDRSAGEWIVMIMLLGIAPIIAGLMMCRKMKHKGRHRQDELIERQILQLARDYQGKLTIPEVSMKMSLSSIEAKAALDQCHLNSLAELHISDNGVVVYQFNM